ncbi:hypothetical protein BH23ACT6_BH23ACT6_04500 [soil metagenome]
MHAATSTELHYGFVRSNGYGPDGLTDTRGVQR